MNHASTMKPYNISERNTSMVKTKLVLTIEDITLLANMDDFEAPRRALEALAMGLDSPAPKAVEIFRLFHNSTMNLLPQDVARMQEVVNNVMKQYEK